MSGPLTQSDFGVIHLVDWVIIVILAAVIGSNHWSLEKRVDALESQATKSQSR